MGEYIPVKDFADRANVTIAAVYRRINNGSLENYIKLEKGVKMVDTDAIELFTPRKLNKDIDKSSQVENADFVYNLLELTIDKLSAQLEIKDKQIADLNERLKEAQALNHNNQVLLLEKQEKLLEEPEPSAPAPEQPTKNRTIRDRFKAFFQ